MDKDLFLSKIEEEAKIYAEETICDPEFHEDAIETVIIDFTEGALTAYKILNS